MRDLFEKYVTMFYFDGKEFWFDWFLEIDKKLCFNDFKKMNDWFQENQDEAHQILEDNKDKILEIEEEHFRLEKEERENRTFAPVTLKSITTEGGMFDESPPWGENPPLGLDCKTRL
jgi:hypothetical protein